MPHNRPNPDPSPRRKVSPGLEGLVQAEKLVQIAILLPSAAFIGWLCGAWLDKRLHQSWIGVVGIIFGGIAGIVHVVRLVIVAGKNSDASEDRGDGGGMGGSNRNS